MSPKTACTMAAVTAFLVLSLRVPGAEAYRYYDDPGTPGQGCVQCHSGFKGQTPLGPLHLSHINDFGVTACNTCHPSGQGSTPVETFIGGDTGSLSCTGCHGRDYGEVSPSSGEPRATAYGLRQFHAANGVNGCVGCHQAGALGHPDPLPAIQREDVLPPYYGTSITNLTDSCSTVEEDSTFDADMIGLDNDGDGAADGNDPDCPTTTSTTTTTTTAVTSTTTTSTTLPPTGCSASPAGGCATGFQKAQLSLKEASPGKAKMRVKWQRGPALAGPSFGDPRFAGGTAYTVCIYGDGVLAGEYVVDRAGDTCAGKPCWKSTGALPPFHTGYKYRDKDTASDGVQKLQLKAGASGRSRLGAKGKNNSRKNQLNLPTGVVAAISGSETVTIQLRASDIPACFSETLMDIQKDDGTRFKARN